MRLQERVVIIFKRIFIVILAVILTSCCGCGCAIAVEPTPSAPQYEKEYLIEQISYYEERMAYANLMKEAAFGLGYNPNHAVVRLAIQEWNAAMVQKNYYQKFLDEILAEEARWEQRMKEYPEATTIWLYLKGLGYNDYVCAGILGNIMVECGGNTLWLQPNIYNPTKQYYGICQWSKTYSPSVFGKSLDFQLDYLKNTIQSEFHTFGKLYQRGFTYKKFIALEDERAAALAFAKCYERCGSDYYYVRQDCATMALNYYTSDE